MSNSDPRSDAERAKLDLARRGERLAAAMREFETLSSAVYHDFQLPLNAIDSTARILGEGPDPLPAETVHGLLAIRRDIAAMKAMIENLRELHALSSQPLELESIDMDALARAAWSGVAHGQRVAFSLGTLPAVRGHRAMLALVWRNLLSGAVHRCDGHDRPRVEVTGGGSGETAVYSVADNGTALDLEYTGKLYYAFDAIQKQSRHPGAAVGLAVVQRIVTRHRGNVWVEARRHKGATFQFSLPVGEVGEDAK